MACAIYDRRVTLVSAEGTESPIAPAKRQTHLDMRLLLLASLVAAIGFVLLPDPRLPQLHQVGNSLVRMLAFRCLVAGCISGLMVFRPNPRWAAAACAAAGATLGMAFLTTALSLNSVHPVWDLSKRSWAGATIVGLALGCGIALLLSHMMSAKWTVAADVLVLTLLVAIMLSYAGVAPGVVRADHNRWLSKQLSLDPQLRQYQSDSAIFLRTYYQMKEGKGFYPAYWDSLNGDLRTSGRLTQVSFFNYREPLVFYLWKALPGSSGMALLRWFLAYGAILLVCSYVLASALVSRGVALLAPVALVSWLSWLIWIPQPGTVRGLPWFPAIEVWAAGFAVAAVMCLVRGWRVPSLLLLIATVASREFGVLLIPAWLLMWWFSRDRKSSWWFPAVAIAGPAFVLGAHYLAVPNKGGPGTGQWLQSSLLRFLTTLRFAFGLMPAGMWIPLAFAAAAIAAAALALPRWRQTSLLAATLIPTAFLLLVGNGGFQWGAFYMPLAVSIAPGVLGRILPAEADPGRPDASDSRETPTADGV